MAREEYREPATTYRGLAGELRQWWRENIVFNWPTHLVFTVLNICFLYLSYYGSLDLWYPVGLHWMFVSLTAYWFVEDWKDD